MRRTLPPLNAVRAFEAAGRLGSFKAAASELGVTQGAISQQVRLLEAWLRAPLFERLNRRVTLTPGGRSYLAEVGQALDRVATATAQYGEAGSTILRVNAPASFSLRWLVPRIATFQAVHPHIKVRIESANGPVDALADRADVIIRGGPDTFHDYRVRPFLSETRLPVCSPALMQRIPLHGVEDLRLHTLLHTLSLPKLWPDWLSKTGAPALEAEADLVLDHIYLTLQAALDGVGVAMGPTALVADDLATGRLVAPFEGPSLAARSYCTYVPLSPAPDERVLAFCAWLDANGNLSGAVGSA
ncbi:transcriptional regulator GcvA [Acidisoma sp. 7E03]